jgi:alpha-mannosidase
MKRRQVFFLLFWISLLVIKAQEPVKVLYLANDTHTDLMWNGDEEKWYQYTLDMAQFYLKLGESTRDNPPESRSKWNYDTAWSLYMLEKRAPRELFERLVAQLKNGQASVPFNFTLPVYGASTLESVLRSFYYGGTLERKYGIPVDLAVCQENATIPLGLASLWAGSGARYSWRGVCNCATKINTVGDRDREIYWYAGLDGSRILMKWYSNYGWNADLGGYAEMLEPTVAVQNMNSLCGSKRYPYFIAGAFGKGWDNIQNYSFDLVWGLGHRTLQGTRLVLSNQIDFFEHFESEYGDRLPMVAVSYGNEWDLNLASLAEVSGKLKRSMEKLRAAEAMAAVVSHSEPAWFEGLEQEKSDFLYGIGVYNLHGWTADGPIDRHVFATYMRNQQKKVEDYTDALHARAVDGLGKLIHAHGLNDVFFVFNALNWERDGLVDIRIEKDLNTARDLESGKILETTVVRKQQSTYLRVWVERIPSVGYRLIQLSREKKSGAKDGFTFAGNRLETPHYSVELLKSGALVSLFDKKNRIDWAGGRLNDLGGGNQEQGEEIRVADRGRSSITLLCRSDDPVKHECAITFYRRSPRIDFQNRIEQNFGGLLHWSFPFNVDKPEVWHEEVGAVILAKPVSAGGHYADRMARTDYLTLNHFVNVGNDRRSITLSNADCLFFRLGDSTPDHLDANSSIVHVLIGGQVNDNLGVIKQDGDTLFHQNFSLFPHDHSFNAGESMRLALEHQNPFDAGGVTRGGTWTQKRHSFVSNDNENAILWTLKPGEEDGLTMRFWNLESKPVVTRTRFSQDIAKVKHASHVETDIAEIPSSGNEVALSLNPHQLKTFRVWLRSDDVKAVRRE